MKNLHNLFTEHTKSNTIQRNQIKLIALGARSDSAAISFVA